MNLSLKPSLFLIPILVIGIMISCGWSPAQQPGLDAPVAVGKWLNGILPAATPGGSGGWTVVNAFPNLTFVDPAKLVAQPRSNKLHVLGKDGFIWSFDNNPTAATKTLVMDIRSRVQATDNTGLVGLAFHPDFGLAGDPDKDYFYLFYSYSPAPVPLPATDPDGDGALQGDETINNTCLRLSRFTMNVDGITADPNSEYVYLQQFDRQAWHNGGSIFFGNDGFLYFCIGDEGLDSDFYKSMQRFNERLLGGVFRIDVDWTPASTRSHAIRRQPVFTAVAPVGNYPDMSKLNPASVLGTNHTFSQGYGIPNDNPWQSPTGTMLEEYWAIGVRSPHTMTYDPDTNSIYSGDVGQATWEEVNLIVKGGDYQWPYKEGVPNFFDNDWGQGVLTKTHTLTSTQQPPLYAYNHAAASPFEGTSVIGGYVYRGAEHGSALSGKYLFSDHGNPAVSHLWTLTPSSTGGAPTVTHLTDMPSGGFHSNISAWGKSHSGEVFMITLGRDPAAPLGNSFIAPTTAGGGLVNKGAFGKIWKLARTGVNNPEPPLLLSQTGAFTNMATLTPAAGLMPYTPVAPFWSDGALKKRWVAIPNNGTHNTADEQVNFSATGEWTWPEGTVMVKHFDLPLSEVDPTLTKKLETRFFVKGTSNTWYGVTYKWRDDGSDADLQYSSSTKDFTITTVTGTRNQQWYFPTRSDCITCHNSNAGSVLGLKTHQLNSLQTYPLTGRSANQLHTWSALGILNPPPTLADTATLPRACHPSDLTATLEHRAKSYLDTNCAACHRPGGANANWDARYNTLLASSTIINGALKQNYLSQAEAAVRPHDPARSIIHLRTASLTPALRMPPLAKNEVDTAGVEVLRAWIDSLDPATDTGKGLKATYFNDQTLTNAVFSRTDGPITFPWGLGSPDPRIPVDNFSARWTGKIIPTTSGSFRFHTWSDQGLRLWINGNLVINDWASHTQYDALSAYMPITANVPLDVVMEYWEGTGDARAELAWSAVSPVVARTVIPLAQLKYPSPDNRPPTAILDNITAVRSGPAVSIPVTTNDFDWENNLLSTSVQITRPPAAGIASVVGSQISYTASPSSALSDSLVYRVSDSAGALSNEAQVQITLVPHSQNWLQTHFNPTEISDPNIGGWTADPDKDGVNNLLEYAMGSLPRDGASRATLSTLEIGMGASRTLEISANKAPGTEGIFSLETSGTLGAWLPAASGLIVENSATLFRAQLPAGAGTLFARIKITLP